MTIIEAMIQLRNDLKLWVTNNLRVKMDKNLGAEESGKILAVDENGDIVPVENTSGSAFVITVTDDIADKTGKEVQEAINAGSNVIIRQIVETTIGSIVWSTPREYEYVGFEVLEALNDIVFKFSCVDGNVIYSAIVSGVNTSNEEVVTITFAETEVGAGGNIEIDSIPTEDSENAISSGAMHKELTTVATAILGLREDKMDKENPTGTGSFSLNRHSSEETGLCSVAMGYNTKAVGNYSYAEGYLTSARGENSHAEGNKTITYGKNAHAEGSNTYGSGMNAHAEGRMAFANGDNSHAEGNETIASSRSQHVQGEYNIEDIVDELSIRGKYAHIVGNGTEEARSNAHTLDWEGNAWFAGDIYVGGTGQDDENAVKVLTENNFQEYAPAAEPFIITITNGTACDKTKGEILSAIENGNVIACEPEIGGSLAMYTWYTFSGADLYSQSSQAKVVYFSCIKDRILYEFSIDCSGEQNEYPTASVPSALSLGGSFLPKVTTSVDLSGFETEGTEGKIVETYSDGTSLTYNFEFDSEGNPTKITDSDGNETVLTW